MPPATLDDPPLQHLWRGGANGAWRVLVACKVLGMSPKDRALWIGSEVIKAWPTPLDMAQAREPALHGVLEPLGLGMTKAKSLIAFSAVVATVDRYTKGSADLSGFDELCLRDRVVIHALPGCGGSAADAVRLFVRGDLKLPCRDSTMENWRQLMLSDQVAAGRMGYFA